MPKSLFNIPNLLSFYRIMVVPLLTIFFFIGGETATWIATFLFFWACISDYLDGVIARRTGQSTIFGKFIDSTSDKILIGSVMMLLVSFGRLTGPWILCALLIFIREILVAGLREFLGQYNVAVPVTWMGKWKTATQMFASGFVMAGNYGPKLVPHSYAIGKGAFIIATLMTLISGWDYLSAGIKTLRRLENEKAREV